MQAHSRLHWFFSHHRLTPTASVTSRPTAVLAVQRQLLLLSVFAVELLLDLPGIKITIATQAVACNLSWLIFVNVFDFFPNIIDGDRPTVRVR